MPRRVLFPILIALILTILFAAPIVDDFIFWGQMDWDQFVSWNAIGRDSLLRFRQFPLWNPYVNGGNVLFAHPHSPFLSPFYIFVIIFGAYIGLKIQIFLYLFIGLLGMYALCRHYKLTPKASFFSAVLFMLNSVYALHVTEGHTEWLVMALLPWLFYFFLKSLQNVPYVIASVGVLSLILLNGSVDVFSIAVAFMLVYAAFKSFSVRSLRPLMVMSGILAGTALFCAVKLLPMLEFLHQFPRYTIDNSGTPWNILVRILLSRHQVAYDLYYIDQTQKMGIQYLWHEYGAYIGVIPLVMVICGMVKTFKSRWPFVCSGIVFLFIALGRNAPVNVWLLLHCFPFWDSQKVPSRYILGFMFVASLMAGYAFSYFEEWMNVLSVKKYRLFKYVPVLILLFVVCDLFAVNRPIFEHAFTIKPFAVKREQAFIQRCRKAVLFENGTSRSSIYPVFLSNSGILEAYEVVKVKSEGVRAFGEEGYRGEVFLAGGRGDADVAFFSPNKVVINVQARQPDILVMNQNYYTGWRVLSAGPSYPAEPYDGMVSTPVPAGKAVYEFYYLPRSFLLGLAVSLGCIVTASIYCYNNRDCFVA